MLGYFLEISKLILEFIFQHIMEFMLPDSTNIKYNCLCI